MAHHPDVDGPDELALALIAYAKVNDTAAFDAHLDAAPASAWGAVLSAYLGVAFVEERVHVEYAGWVFRRDSPIHGYCWAVLNTIDDLQIARLDGAGRDDIRLALRGLAFAIAAEPCGEERLLRDLATRRRTSPGTLAS